MGSRTATKALRALGMQDLRFVMLILLGSCAYCLIFSAFGAKTAAQWQTPRTDEFPRKLWQSWKTDPASFEFDDAVRARSWFKYNPSMRYEVITDGNAQAYLHHIFSAQQLNRPDVVMTYQEVTSSIVKADLLRYVIMYAEGGIYADIDVQAIEAFDKFIPAGVREADIDMIIGIETDQPEFKSHPVLGLKAQSFCQWTFVAKPKHPAMLRLINNVVAWLELLSKDANKNIRDLEFDFDAIINGTGPTAFTNAILTQMSISTGKQVTWDDFHNLREPKVVGGVLVLPAQAFAANTGHSDSGHHLAMGALVRHNFGASQWTKQHQRFKHPVYGMIESCNWNPKCIKLWDENTARFDKLTKEEQMSIVLNLEQEKLNTKPLEQSDDKVESGTDTPSQDSQEDASENKDEDHPAEDHDTEKATVEKDVTSDSMEKGEKDRDRQDATGNEEDQIKQKPLGVDDVRAMLMGD